MSVPAWIVRSLLIGCLVTLRLCHNIQNWLDTFLTHLIFDNIVVVLYVFGGRGRGGWPKSLCVSICVIWMQAFFFPNGKLFHCYFFSCSRFLPFVVVLFSLFHEYMSFFILLVVVVCNTFSIFTRVSMIWFVG